jgi:hypothetical protein
MVVNDFREKIVAHVHVLTVKSEMGIVVLVQNNVLNVVLMDPIVVQ